MNAMPSQQPTRVPERLHRSALTILELLIVATLLSLILMAVYRIFFSQAKMVTQSIEFLHVNDSFRKIGTVLGADIREATNIEFPVPIHHEKIDTLTTQTGVILKLTKNEIDPSLPFTATMGQVAVRREIHYELEPNPHPAGQGGPRFRLMRTEFIEDSSGKQKQRREIVDNIRDMVAFRTLNKPMAPRNITSISDRILQPIPATQNGSGHNVVHVKVTVERPSSENQSQVYQISMLTSFYKRGREVFTNQ